MDSAHAKEPGAGEQPKQQSETEPLTGKIQPSANCLFTVRNGLKTEEKMYMNISVSAFLKVYCLPRTNKTGLNHHSRNFIA
ncbi:hypothetical protein [Acinetobacter sp. F16]|uniref:hypothetical protein n=1 Tax=Acinetobacter sp. F16 TaxID=3462438 RepID=UPI004046B025